MTPEDALQQVNDSGLRGRGGAAFPTATKWRFLAGNPSRDKYVLCNCEEGDPGAFNDKAILESDPHTLIEGVIIAGYATGASRGYIFIRHGHDGPIERCPVRCAAGARAWAIGEKTSWVQISASMLKLPSLGIPTWPGEEKRVDGGHRGQTGHAPLPASLSGAVRIVR